MDQPRRGRPPKPLDPAASQGARLGAEIRSRRQSKGLTLKALAQLIGFSFQHISEVERCKASASGPFVAACDRALQAQGTLMEMLPAAVLEQSRQRHQRSAARRATPTELDTDDTPALAPALGIERYAGPQSCSELEEDVDPVSRRSLLGTGVGAALGLNATTAPATAREIDPGFVESSMQLLAVVSRHGARCGPREVLGPVRQQIGMIARYRKVAGGQLQNQLLRVEARWADLGASLSNQIGDRRQRDVWAEHALQFAEAVDDGDLIAHLLKRQSQWAASDFDAQRTITFAEAALGVSGATEQTRALAGLKAAFGYALAGDADSCERSLADTAHLLANMPASEPATPWEDLRKDAISAPHVRAAAARCWLSLRPQKAIAMLEDVLPRWPRDETSDRGLHQARLGLACAAANEPDRAASEGMKALGIARRTRSDLIVRELKRLDQKLVGFDVAGVREFREALAKL